MNVVLWILQAVLAVAFATAGLMKVTQPKGSTGSTKSWVDGFSPATVRSIGVVELLAAVALIVPWATGVAPVLVPIAATVLAVIMAFAAASHLRRRVPAGVAPNAVLFLLAGVVAFGRFGPYAS